MSYFRLVVLFAALIAAAETAVRLFQVPEYLSPRPLSIIIWISRNWEIFLRDFLMTAGAAVAGLGISISICLAIFLLSAVNKGVLQRVQAAALGVQAIPILALSPFLNTWFGPELGSKVAASSLVCGPVMISSICGACIDISTDELGFAKRIYRNKWTLTAKFLLPRSLPGFFAGLKVSSSLCVLGAIVGEFVGSSAGLGFRILSGSYYLRTSEMAAGIVGAVLLSLFLLLLASSIEKRVLFWNRS